MLTEVFGREHTIEEPADRRYESPIDRAIRELRAAPHQLFLGLILAGKLVLEYGGVLAAVGLMLIRRDWAPPVVILGVVLYFAAVTGELGTERFRAPMIPLFLPFAAYGLHQAFSLLPRPSGKHPQQAESLSP